MESELDEDGLCLRGLPCHRVSSGGKFNNFTDFHGLHAQPRKRKSLSKIVIENMSINLLMRNGISIGLFLKFQLSTLKVKYFLLLNFLFVVFVAYFRSSFRFIFPFTQTKFFNSKTTFRRTQFDIDVQCNRNSRSFRGRCS